MARRLTRIGLVSLLIGAVLAGCPKPPPVFTATRPPLIVGIEYAPPGMAAALGGIRAPAAKLFPELYQWGDMQRDPASAIDFEMLDRLVREYHAAGYALLMLGLHSKSPWGSKDPGAGLVPGTNFAPKPEHESAYAAWITAIAERYDADGTDDMPGLLHPVQHLEIGVEFSSFEPEPAGEYLRMLEIAYHAAHAANPDAAVLHAAFLTTTAFDAAPGPGEYEAAFAGMEPRIAHHSLDAIRAVLDRPDLFDALNVHALAAPGEIEHIAAWLRHEQGVRGYEKPVIISDTSTSPLIAWGPATRCTGTGLGIVIAPAREEDRCRLAAFFQRLIANDEDALAFARAHAARDMAKKTVIAAGEGIAWINTAFMEDLVLLQGLLQAGAGMAAWGGMARSSANGATQQRRVHALHPLHHALAQLLAHLDGYDVVTRLEDGDPEVFAYIVGDDGDAAPFFIAWHEPEHLVLPGDPVPDRVVTLDVQSDLARAEWLITDPGQTQPLTADLATEQGRLTLGLTPTPVFVFPN